MAIGFKLPENEWISPVKTMSAWQERYKRLLPLVPLKTTSLMDFGAYDCYFETLLPRTIRYIPLDLHARESHPALIVCDLNSDPLPSLPRHDVAVFSGVLEYLEHVPHVIEHVAQYCQYGIICTYAYRRPFQYAHRRAEFEEIFLQVGFTMGVRDLRRPDQYAVYLWER